MSDSGSRGAQIAHVLFIDIVGYSRESTSAQGRLMASLNEAVQGSEAFQAARQIDAVQPLPTGDGMALLFYNDVIAPARCAVEVSRELKSRGTAGVRMGLHSGLVQKQIDIAGRENVVGEGINTAQRVMDFGEAGSILLSAQYANWLQQFDEWATLVHPLGQGVAKHGVVVTLFSLHGADFGVSPSPKTLDKARQCAAAPKASVAAQKIALLYKPNVQPDEGVLRLLEERLRQEGHTVFVDNQQKINANWAAAIEQPIREADAVIAIVSPKSLQSEMLEFEIQTASDQFARTGKPVLLPVRIGHGEVDDGMIAAIIRPLNQFAWGGPEDDQKLIAELISAIHQPLKPRAEEVPLEPVGGAVPPDSPFYIERAADLEFRQALMRRESILLIKGARQMGKTSMQAQGIKLAREQGWRVGIIDFQKFNTAQIADDGVFYRILAATLARQLKFKYDFDAEWDDIFGSNMNMESFLRELLDSSDDPLVWFMDEADKVFGAPFASDFFGLVRSWHNSRSTEPGGPWDKLTVVISYATEAHLFIQDLNQSPFNVGRRMELDGFNQQQLVDLNGRYGSPLRSYEEVERLNAMISGQPFLARRALDVLATGKATLPELEETADRDDGPFGDHLKRILVSVSRLPNVVSYVRSALEGAAKADQDAYYRLLAAGIIRVGGDGRPFEFRCQLYERYLRGHLSM